MLDILLVDDSPSDAKLVRHFARLAKVANPIQHVDSGAAALEFLSSDEPLPGLVLLDLNMPVMDGHDVLRAIRAHPDPAVARLPVVILTTSDNPAEISRAYDEAANSFVVKPVDGAGFQRILGGLAEYWFEIVRIP